jgi:hypothetical protein
VPIDMTIPLEAHAIASRLGELAADLGQREVLRERTAALAAGRTWHEVVRRHLELYEEAA